MAPAEIFAKILNKDPTKSTNIGYYLMERIIDVANLYLLKIKSIRKLHFEDSFSDIVEMGLKLSLCTWGFSIHPNPLEVILLLKNLQEKKIW